MNSPQRKPDIGDARYTGATGILVLFAEMAREEWRKLLADVARAFGAKRSHSNTATLIEEKRFGDQ